METVLHSSSTFEFIASDDDEAPSLRPNPSLEDLLQEQFQDTRKRYGVLVQECIKEV